MFSLVIKLAFKIRTALNKNIKRLTVENKLNDVDKDILNLAINILRNAKSTNITYDIDIILINFDNKILRQSKFFAEYLKKFFYKIYSIRDLLENEPLKIKDLKKILEIYKNFNFERCYKKDILEEYFKEIDDNLYILYNDYAVKNSDMFGYNTTFIFNPQFENERNVVDNRTYKNKINKINSIKYLKEIMGHKFIQKQLVKNYLIDNNYFINGFFQNMVSKIEYDGELNEPVGNPLFMINDKSDYSYKYFENKRKSDGHTFYTYTTNQENNQQTSPDKEQTSSDKEQTSPDKIPSDIIPFSNNPESIYQLLIKFNLEPKKVKINKNSNYTYNDKTLTSVMRKKLVKIHPNHSPSGSKNKNNERSKKIINNYHKLNEKLREQKIKRTKN